MILIATAIAIALFVLQYKGTDKVASVFGPIMVVWFATLTFTGLVSL